MVSRLKMSIWASLDEVEKLCKLFLALMFVVDCCGK